jgi:hypothetical protein
VSPHYTLSRSWASLIYRLMGEYGLPALMKDAKRFKVRGKGHEVSRRQAWTSAFPFECHTMVRRTDGKAQDLKSLLSTYQIWAHRMFPRGDFMGTMGRVENVLRTRRMEVSPLHPPFSHSIPPHSLSLLSTFSNMKMTIIVITKR